MTLERELEYFSAHKAELLETYEGLYVLVKEDEFAGAFTTEKEAYEAGLERFGNQPFLIKRVLRQEDETAHYPALVLGVLHAHS
jgi:hypothetical protein